MGSVDSPLDTLSEHVERVKKKLEALKETAEYREAFRGQEDDLRTPEEEMHEIMLRQIAGYQLDQAKPPHRRNHRHYNKMHRETIENYMKTLTPRDWEQVRQQKQGISTGARRRQHENAQNASSGWAQRKTEQIANHYHP